MKQQHNNRSVHFGHHNPHMNAVNLYYLPDKKPNPAIPDIHHSVDKRNQRYHYHNQTVQSLRKQPDRLLNW